jgi:sugar lactone lactonase YvrE
MLSFKRRKTGGLAQVSTLHLPGLGQPRGFCCLADGSILLTTENKIVVCFPSGLLPCTLLTGREFRGSANGSLMEASFDDPSGLLLRANGDFVVVDTSNNTLRFVHKDRRDARDVVSTLAGARDDSGFADGLAVDRSDEQQALFNGPSCAVLLECGDIAVLDTNNHALRLLTSSGKVSTLAGNGDPGFLDGRGRDARFRFPGGLAFDHAEKRLIVSDSGNHAIRMVCMKGTVTTIAGNGQAGFLDDLCASALFSSPLHVVVDGKGKILIADTGNNRIRAIERTTPLRVTTLVGGQNVAGPVGKQRVDGVASEARFKEPTTLALDHFGRLLVAEKHGPDQLRIVDVGLEPPVCFDEPEPSIVLRLTRGNAFLRALEDFSKLQDEPETADVVFAVEGERFPAHRLLVSRRCPYLSNMLKFHAAQKDFVLEDLSAAAFRVICRYLYSAEMPLFPSAAASRHTDAPSLESTALAREVLMTADKWGIDDLYQHFVDEFKRQLTDSNCAEALVWSMTKGTVETSKTARAFFVKHRHDIKEHAADTLHLLKGLSPEQMHELLLAVLLE